MNVIVPVRGSRVNTRLRSATVATVVTFVVLTCVGAGLPALAVAQGARPAAAALGATTTTEVEPTANASVERGRYIVAISGCNDCHTGGYSDSGGRVPEGEWLTGVSVGFQGPWGTSYPTNLRLTVQSMTEAQWLTFARVERLPPMPWFALRDMSDTDLRSMYRFIRSLGPKGTPMPAAAGPGVKVATPYIVFVPQNLPAQSVTQAKSAALK